MNWSGKRVLLTGHTGFKGSWLSLWMQQKGAELCGLALNPPTTMNIFQDAAVERGMRSAIGDIRDTDLVRKMFLEHRPEIVFHLAAQPLVRSSYDDPVGTYTTNVIGTASVLEAVRNTDSVRAVVVVTTDKCYENREWEWPYRETDRLGGYDPYSNSKACAELLTGSFRDSFFSDGAPIATARAGNVIGGGDWSQDRLIPDCVRALKAGEPVSLRYPEAIRPWQHVLEPLSGYLALAQALVQAPAASPRCVNFGPNPSSFCSVREVVEAFSARFSGRPGWRRDTGTHVKEASALTLSSALAQNTLGWRPRLSIGESLAWTADWYRAHAAGEDMTKYSEAQIAQYQSLPAARS
jgi:CDP-glucose 4,6-dehydratase